MIRRNRMQRVAAAAALSVALLALPGAGGAQDYEASSSRSGSGGTPLGASMKGETKFEKDDDSNVGRIEAKLLAGVVVKQAARRIVDATGTDFSSLTMVVLPVPQEAENASSMVGGKGWDVLEGKDKLPVVVDMVRVRERLERFGQRYAGIVTAGTRACRANVQSELTNKGVIDQLNSITGVLNTATPLLNLFKQDFLYRGLDLRVRDGMLVAAVRGEIAARRKPAVPSTSAGGADTFREAIDTLGGQLAALPPQASCGESDGGAEAARAKLAAEFEGFLGELSGPASQGDTSLIAAAEDQLRRFGPRPAALVLAIDADGASLVKRSNLGTMFGAESTTVSSGIVVSYEFYEPQASGIGSLKAAGVLSCVSGAVGIRAMHNGDRIKNRATCY